MSLPTSGGRFGRWVEYAFIPLIFAGLIYALLFLRGVGYMPQPFFYEPSGTYMDWFALGYWARHSGAYDVEAAIYPPLSFLVLRLIGDGSCYTIEGPEARACDWQGIIAIHVFYLLNIILIARTYMKLDRKTALPRSIALAAGLPMVYALERGNLILICFACLLLAYGPLVRSARLRWLFAGLAVNFKVYLIAGVLAPLLRRRWTAVEGALLATVGVYLVSWYLFGSGSPLEIIRNIQSFSSQFISATPLDLWYPSSYGPALSLLDGATFPISTFLGSDLADKLEMGLRLFVLANQLAILAAVFASWLRPEVVPNHRLVLFGIALALMTAESGGYTQILILPFVFMEKWRGIGRPGALLIAYILSIPMEYVIAPLPSGIVRDSFMAGHEVIAYFGVGLMSLLRPALIQLMSTFLAAVTLHDVWNDLRSDGWGDRWRYRRDWSVVPWARRPERPLAEVIPPGTVDS